MKDILTRLKHTAGLGRSRLQPQWLTGQFLVAMPGMTDPRFNHAVIYICTHNHSGAMGLVINRLFGDADFPMLMNQLNVEHTVATPDIAVHFGGPIEMGRGFVLHTGDYLRQGTTRIDETIALTATLEIIEDIAAGRGPEQRMIALGYAGWGAGQLEEEIKNNGWLTVAADEALLFDTDLESKWQRAMTKIGVNPAMLSNDTVGHA